MKKEIKTLTFKTAPSKFKCLGINLNGNESLYRESHKSLGKEIKGNKEVIYNQRWEELTLPKGPSSAKYYID